MSPSGRRQNPEPMPWKVCLECGNRFQATRHGFGVNWCSARCEHASMRRQREAIENTWVRARWFLR